MVAPGLTDVWSLRIELGRFAALSVGRVWQDSAVDTSPRSVSEHPLEAVVWGQGQSSGAARFAPVGLAGLYGCRACCQQPPPRWPLQPEKWVRFTSCAAKDEAGTAADAWRSGRELHLRWGPAEVQAHHGLLLAHMYLHVPPMTPITRRRRPSHFQRGLHTNFSKAEPPPLLSPNPSSLFEHGVDVGRDGEDDADEDDVHAKIA